jgi:hypothetical protein
MDGDQENIGVLHVTIEGGWPSSAADLGDETPVRGP